MRWRLSQETLTPAHAASFAKTHSPEDKSDSVRAPAFHFLANFAIRQNNIVSRKNSGCIIASNVGILLPLAEIDRTKVEREEL